MSFININNAHNILYNKRMDYMYKNWTVKDIEEVIKELNVMFNYECNIPVQISKRATKRMGAFFYKKYTNKIEPMKFVFAEDLVKGSYQEKIVKEVIIHEYIHYYCDTRTGVSNGHNKVFKEVCRKVGISDKATFRYNTEKNSTGKRYNIYCSNCNKLVCVHKRKDAAHRKVDEYISKCCKAKLYLRQ